MSKDVDTWVDATKALLDSLNSKDCQPYSIPIVEDELRKWSEKVYEPKLASIGPRYKGRKELLPMEEIKWRCMMSLFNRNRKPGIDTRDILRNSMELMLELDAAVRTNYGEEIKLDRHDLATIMLHDGCFLLELLISRSTEWNSKLKSNMLAPELGKMEMILSDLILLENQIPFFVIYKLFQRLFGKVVRETIANDNICTYSVPELSISITEDLALSLFGYSRDSCSSSIPNSSSNPIFNPTNASHFLELLHSFILSKNNQQSEQNSSVVDIDIDIKKQLELNRCATRLRAAGVVIDRCDENSVIPKFSSGSGVLEIPPLHITQTMEANWRSFIAWEHHKRKWKKCVGRDAFTFRALLINDLICCASDVQLLKNRGIVKDELSRSNHDLLHLFRSITIGVERDLVDSSYSNIIDALNTYSATNHAVRFPIIVWHYLSRFSEWLYGLYKFLRHDYNFALSLVTLFTLIQTFYAVLSYHRPN